MSSKEKSKKEQPFKLWEKIFIGISSLLIVIIIGVYSCRLVYYYKIEHPDVIDNSLRTKIIKKGTVYSGDGLYSFDQEEYYYKGEDVNNYVWYSGRLWQIISINDQGIKMITDRSQGSVVWAMNLEYNESYIKKWLGEDGEFLNSLGNYQEYLVENEFCIDKFELTNVTCNNYVNSYVGLLSVNEYLRANGKDSYLNNGEYYWLMNSSIGNRAYYVFSEGGINNETSMNETYYSYGVRPVVVLSKEVNYYGGDGTLESPYQVNMKSEDTLKSKSVGEYVMINDYRYRIQKQENKYTMLIMDELVSDNKNKVKKNYQKGISYLNNEFYKTLPKDKLLKCDFNTGTYGKKSSYDYMNVKKKTVNSYVGVPSIGELFTSGVDNYWLYNTYDENNSLQYKINSDGRIMADDKGNKNYLRAIICLDNEIVINEGTGLIDSPYVVMR